MEEAQVIFEFSVGGYLVDDRNDSSLHHEIDYEVNQTSMSRKTNECSTRYTDYREIPWQVAISDDGKLVAVLLSEKLMVSKVKGENQFQTILPRGLQRNIRSRHLLWDNTSTYVIVSGHHRDILVYDYNCQLVSSVSFRANQCLKVMPTRTALKDSLQFHSIYNTAEVITWQVSENGTYVQRSKFDIPSLSTIDDTLWIEEKCILIFFSSEKGWGTILKATIMTIYFDAVTMSWQRHQSIHPQSLDIQRGPPIDITVDSSVSKLLFGLGKDILPSQWLTGEEKVAMPIIQLAENSTKSIIIAVHADGYLSILSIGSDMSLELRADRVSLPFTSFFPESSLSTTPPSSLSITPPPIVTTTRSVHFLSHTGFVAVTSAGEVGLFNLSADYQSFTIATVDTLPPPLGLCVSCLASGRSTSNKQSIPSTNIENSNKIKEGMIVVFLRAIDSWTCQLFTMKIISPYDAIQTKIKEGLFTSAYHLAQRFRINGDLISIAEWSHRCRDHQNPLTAGDLDILRRIQDNELVIEAVLDFSDSNSNEKVWYEVLKEGITRIQSILLLTGNHSSSGSTSSSSSTHHWNETLSVLHQRLQKLQIWYILHAYQTRSTSRHPTKPFPSQEVEEGDVDVDVDDAMEVTSTINLNTSFASELLGSDGVDNHIGMMSDIVKFILEISMTDICRQLAREAKLTELTQIIGLYAHLLSDQLLSILTEIPPLHLVGKESLLRELRQLLPVPAELWPINHANNNAIYVMSDNGEVQTLTSFVDNEWLESNYQTPPLMIPHLPEDQYSFTTPVIARWYCQQAVRMELLGQSGYALFYCEEGWKRCMSVSATNLPANEDDDDEDDAIEDTLTQIELKLLLELRNQLYHYCQLIYHHCLENEISFSFFDWYPLSIEEQLKLVLLRSTGTNSTSSSSFPGLKYYEQQQQQQPPPSSKSSLVIPSLSRLSLLELITTFLCPMYRGSSGSSITGNTAVTKVMNKALFQTTLSSVLPKYFLLLPTIATSTFTTTTAVNQSVASDWENILIDVLVTGCSQSNISYLEQICEVAEASLPTLPPDTRCISQVTNLVRLVVQACFAFDQVAVALPVMWRLIETTPTTLTTTSEEEKHLLHSLDRLQASLSACEILKEYLTPPPLHVLLPVDHSSKVSRRKFIKELLTGKVWLASGIEDILLATTTGSKSNEDNEIEKNQNSLFSFEQAIILQMCFTVKENMLKDRKFGKKKGMDGSSRWIKLIKDVLELAESFFPLLPKQWCGCIILRTILQFDSIEIVSKLILSLLTTYQETNHQKDPNSNHRLVASANTESVKSTFGAYWLRLDLTISHAIKVVVVRARDTYNASDTLSMTSLSEAKAMLLELQSTLTSFSYLSDNDDIYDKSEINSELALYEIAAWIVITTTSTTSTTSTTGRRDGIDCFPPIKLRLMSASSIVSMVLQCNPSAVSYFMDEGFEESDLINAQQQKIEDGSSQSTSLYSKHFLLPKGSYHLIKLLKTIFQYRFQSSHQSQSLSHLTYLAEQLRVWSVLTEAAVTAGNIRSAFLYSRQLIVELESEHTTDFEHSFAYGTVVNVIHTIEGLLKQRNEGGSSESREYLKMHAFLCSALVTDLPLSYVDSSFALWKQHLLLEYNTHNNDDDSIDDKSQSADKNWSWKYCLSQAHESLLQVTGSILINNNDAGWMHTAQPPSRDFIHMISAPGMLSDVIGYFLLASSTTSTTIVKEEVDRLLHGLTKDLEKKLANTGGSNYSTTSGVDQAISQQRSSSTTSKNIPKATMLHHQPINEEMASLLESMGFSKQGARRSVQATNSSTIEAALRWAIDHSSDADFDEPLPVIRSSGAAALLPDTVTIKVDSADIQKALVTIGEVALTYSIVVPFVQPPMSIPTISSTYPASAATGNTTDSSHSMPVITDKLVDDDHYPQTPLTTTVVDAITSPVTSSSMAFPVIKANSNSTTSPSEAQEVVVVSNAVPVVPVISVPPTANESLSTQLAKAAAVTKLDKVLLGIQNSLIHLDDVTFDASQLSRHLILRNSNNHNRENHHAIDSDIEPHIRVLDRICSCLARYSYVTVSESVIWSSVSDLVASLPSDIILQIRNSIEQRIGLSEYYPPWSRTTCSTAACSTTTATATDGIPVTQEQQSHQLFYAIENDYSLPFMVAAERFLFLHLHSTTTTTTASLTTAVENSGVVTEPPEIQEASYLTILSKHPNKFLQLLSFGYTLCDGQELLILAKIKTLTGNLLGKKKGGSGGYGMSDTTTAQAETVARVCHEEALCLRRVQRLERGTSITTTGSGSGPMEVEVEAAIALEGGRAAVEEDTRIDGKVLLMSEDLLPSMTLQPPPKIKTIKVKDKILASASLPATSAITITAIENYQYRHSKALQAVRKRLKSPSNAVTPIATQFASWHRAIGRILDVTVADLQLLYLAEIIQSIANVICTTMTSLPTSSLLSPPSSSMYEKGDDDITSEYLLQQQQQQQQQRDELRTLLAKLSPAQLSLVCQYVADIFPHNDHNIPPTTSEDSRNRLPLSINASWDVRDSILQECIAIISPKCKEPVQTTATSLSILLTADTGTVTNDILLETLKILRLLCKLLHVIPLSHHKEDLRVGIMTNTIGKVLPEILSVTLISSDVTVTSSQFLDAINLLHTLESLGSDIIVSKDYQISVDMSILGNIFLRAIEILWSSGMSGKDSCERKMDQIVSFCKYVNELLIKDEKERELVIRESFHALVASFTLLLLSENREGGEGGEESSVNGPSVTTAAIYVKLGELLWHRCHCHCNCGSQSLARSQPHKGIYFMYRDELICQCYTAPVSHLHNPLHPPPPPPSSSLIYDDNTEVEVDVDADATELAKDVLRYLQSQYILAEIRSYLPLPLLLPFPMILLTSRAITSSYYLRVSPSPSITTTTTSTHSPYSPCFTLPNDISDLISFLLDVYKTSISNNDIPSSSSSRNSTNSSMKNSSHSSTPPQLSNTMSILSWLARLLALWGGGTSNISLHFDQVTDHWVRSAASHTSGPSSAIATSPSTAVEASIGEEDTPRDRLPIWSCPLWVRILTFYESTLSSLQELSDRELLSNILLDILVISLGVFRLGESILEVEVRDTARWNESTVSGEAAATVIPLTHSASKEECEVVAVIRKLCTIMTPFAANRIRSLLGGQITQQWMSEILTQGNATAFHHHHHQLDPFCLMGITCSLPPNQWNDDSMSSLPTTATTPTPTGILPLLVKNSLRLMETYIARSTSSKKRKANEFSDDDSRECSNFDATSNSHLIPSITSSSVMDLFPLTNITTTTTTTITTTTTTTTSTMLPTPILPYAASPHFLTRRLLSIGKIGEAAQLVWLTRRMPAALYSPALSLSMLQSQGEYPERDLIWRVIVTDILTYSWGWRHWTADKHTINKNENAAITRVV